MRLEDIKEVLSDYSDELQLLKELKEQDSKDESKTRLRPAKVASLATHALRILEYSAQDIRESLKTKYGIRNIPDPKKFRFEYWSTDSQVKFDEWVDKFFPHLKSIFPKLYDELRSLQPFSASRPWLSLIKLLNNDGKHNQLGQQDNVKSQNIVIGGAIEFPDGAQPTIINSNIGGKLVNYSATKDLLGNIQHNFHDNYAPVEFIDYHNFKFKVTGDDVLEFFDFVKSVLERYLKEVYP